MLEFLKVQNPEQIKSLLKTYNPLTDTWIVSDLKSKQEIQNECVKQQGYFTDDAIMRVSDFWRLWIRRIEPTLQVVGSDFIRSLIQNFVDLYGEKLGVLESETSTLDKAVQEFAPILLHPASDEILTEWLSSQSQPKKWHRWYKLSKICLKYIVEEKKALDSKWSAAYLQTVDLAIFSWPRKMIVDLGSELTTVEMGLFKHLSQQQQVTLVTPEPIWKEKFPYLLNTYKENFGFGKVQELSAVDVKAYPSHQLSSEQFVRLSTQLAEIKFAVATVRKWAEAGVDLNQIAIVSTEIESYWPVLRHYLFEEGLPARKGIVARLNSLGDVQSLLAALKSYSSDVAWDSLERSYFADNEKANLNFDKFKSLFYQLYDQDDLGRDQKIKDLFYRQLDFNSEIDRDGFLAAMVKVWMLLPTSKNKNELFELIFKDFLGQSLNIRMRFSRWTQFLKNRLSSKEITIERDTQEGVYVLPLMSAQMIEVSHRIYLGLNDEFYHKKQTSLMSLQDSMTLRSQFDLAVDFSEESYADFNLRWQGLSCDQNTLFTTSHMSFKAEPLNSSLFFIENSPVSAVLNPEPTRLDELQKNMGAQSQWDVEASVFSQKRLLEDLHGYEGKVVSPVFKELSVSDVENYAQCGFKLLAAKGFRLRDLPQISLDLDPRQRGSLVHALFEYCLQQMENGNYTIAGVQNFLDEKREEFGLYRQQDSHWQIQRAKLVLLAERFYNFELDRLKFFKTQTEKVVQVHFDLQQLKFAASKPEVGFQFNFRIDRIDTHKQKNYTVVYDYKSSSYQVSNYGSWLTKLQFQMMLYMLSLELLSQDATDDIAPVKAALYYQYKTFDLSKGIIEQELALTDFGMTKRNKSLIADEVLQEFKNEFSAKVAEVLTKLNESIFSTVPADFETCKECDWRKLCRAPHLM
ncbi:PD-(D/E)XK nuclease family protein [Pseudobdellovibrio exovorus]|uniref:Putative exonuclease n=1 Tax=Pseudobdellovibrio exovorus JSS TaxID=1184267 RepID=M4VSL4_9BACT|nr:PD-(D/E)XK nuclease family protein [Pseudobdellovibrio exovorus]AGH96204.1 putative exonuclease [Pseudobdellovibrio exovorus JSS]